MPKRKTKTKAKKQQQKNDPPIAVPVEVKVSSAIDLEEVTKNLQKMTIEPRKKRSVQAEMKQMKKNIEKSKSNMLQPKITPEVVKASIDKNSTVLSQFVYCQDNLATAMDVNVREDNQWHQHVSTMTAGYRSFSPQQIFQPSYLNRIDIFTLSQSPNVTFEGKFLLCRTITPASKIIAIETIVDDPEGAFGVRLALYNYSEEAAVGVTDFDDVLPPGSLLVVKNPCLQPSRCGALIIRVDNTADIEMIHPKKAQELSLSGLSWHPFPYYPRTIESFWLKLSEASDQKIFETLRNLGNKGFVTKRYTDAIRWYNLALDYVQTTEDKVTTFSNKAAALMAIECFNAAVKSLNQALDLDPFDLKAVYRKVKCYIAIADVDSALNFLDAVFKGCPKLSENQELCDTIDVILDLQKGLDTGITGESFKLLGSMQKWENIPRYMIAGEVKESEGKGFGYFATQNIYPGQSFCCDKAMAYYKRRSQPNNVYSSFNYETNSATIKPGHNQLVALIANKVWLDPGLGRDLYSLTAGESLGHLKDDDHCNQYVDMHRIDRIVALNAFAWPGFNSKREKDGYLYEGSALHVGPSVINHSCSEANCFTRMYQGIMIITACKEISEGEEILISYTSPITSLEKRQSFLQSYDFSCDCRLCTLDQSERKSVREKREKILKRLASMSVEDYERKPDKVSQAFEDVMTLDSMRNNPAMNPVLLSPSVSIVAEAFLALDKPKKCLILLEKMYKVTRLGVHWHDLGVRIAINTARCYMLLKDVPEVLRWVAEVRFLLLHFYLSIEFIGYIAPNFVDELKKQLDIDYFTADTTNYWSFEEQVYKYIPPKKFSYSEESENFVDTQYN